MKNTRLALLIFSTIFFTGCSAVSPRNTEGLTIISGQSFGFCIGPCFQTMTLNGNNTKLSFFVRETESRGGGNVANETTFNDELTDSEWTAILKEVDLEVFYTLNEVYGCPDCADGGAEFIEFREGEKTHRVTFEYGKEVKGIENLITLLRNKRTDLSQKYLTKE